MVVVIQVLISVSYSAQRGHGYWFYAGTMADIVEFTSRKAYQDGSLSCSEPGYLVLRPFCTSQILLTSPSACASSIMKITFLSSYGLSGDFLYDSTGLCIWTTTEVNVGILAASIPCLKPLFRVLLEKSGRVPKDSLLDVPGLSYFMQSSAARSNQEHRDENQIYGGESGVNMHILREMGFTTTAREDVDEISENMLHIRGPAIVKTRQMEIYSEKRETAGSLSS